MNKNRKIIIVIAVIIALALIAIAIIFFLNRRPSAGPGEIGEDYWNQDHGWIDCMPGVGFSDSQAELCAEAKKHNYPKIAE